MMMLGRTLSQVRGHKAWDEALESRIPARRRQIAAYFLGNHAVYRSLKGVRRCLFLVLEASRHDPRVCGEPQGPKPRPNSELY